DAGEHAADDPSDDRRLEQPPRPLALRREAGGDPFQTARGGAGGGSVTPRGGAGTAPPRRGDGGAPPGGRAGACASRRCVRWRAPAAGGLGVSPIVTGRCATGRRAPATVAAARTSSPVAALVHRDPLPRRPAIRGRLRFATRTGGRTPLPPRRARG